MRTIEEVLSEVQGIINNTYWVETRLAELQVKGYQIEDCWVNNGNIGTIWYMKRKQLYKIQVTESELHGKYHKAYCVVIPFNELSVQISELAEIRNTVINKKPEKNCIVVYKDKNIRVL
jgi:hypothetical protein